MKKWPKNVKIGNLSYEIKELPPVPQGDFPHKGIIYYREQEILIDPGLKPDAIKECFLHEFFHGILAQAGFDKQSDDEVLIRSLSNGFFQIFTDNPGLKEFLWGDKWDDK